MGVLWRNWELTSRFHWLNLESNGSKKHVARLCPCNLNRLRKVTPLQFYSFFIPIIFFFFCFDTDRTRIPANTRGSDFSSGLLKWSNLSFPKTRRTLASWFFIRGGDTKLMEYTSSRSIFLSNILTIYIYIPLHRQMGVQGW